jgi:hypothetical protein
MKYYNGARTHLSLEKDAPVSRAVDPEVIVRRQRLRVNVRVSHTFQTLASGKRRRPVGHRFCQIEPEKCLAVS